MSFLVTCFPAVNYGPVRTKECERLKFKTLRENNDNYNAKLTIDIESFTELEWWGRVGLLNNNPICSSHFDITIFSDASTAGWGISCNGKLSHNFWKKHERSLSINYLELNAAFLGLQCFASDLKDCQILLRIDNTTSISYINRMGGVQLENLSLIAKQIWGWCEP